MKKEKSCGAVVYKKEENNVLFLLLKHNSGHWSFPKGHVEEKETEEKTALREIKEETNLEVSIDKGFRKVSTYSPKEGVLKDVIFFVAKVENKQEMHAQESEIEKIDWFSYEKALDRITYDKDKEVLQAAAKYIRSNY